MFELTPMIMFYIISGISAVGIIAVLFLLKNDKSTFVPENKVEPIKPEDIVGLSALKKTLGQSDNDKPSNTNTVGKFNKAPTLNTSKANEPQKDKLNLIGKMLKKFKKGDDLDDIPEVTPLPSLREALNIRPNTNTTNNQSNLNKTPSETGTASLKTAPVSTTNVQKTTLPPIQTEKKEDQPKSESTLTASEEKEIDLQVETSVKIDELKAKYEKMEKMFEEKQQNLEKITLELENEKKHRKDFNKVKDLLEKELKESKDRYKEMQLDLNQSIKERENLTEKISLLETKAINLEKELATIENPEIIENKSTPAINNNPPNEITENIKPSDQPPEANVEHEPIEKVNPAEEIKINKENKPANLDSPSEPKNIPVENHPAKVELTNDIQLDKLEDAEIILEPMTNPQSNDSLPPNKSMDEIAKDLGYPDPSKDKTEKQPVDDLTSEDSTDSLETTPNIDIDLTDVDNNQPENEYVKLRPDILDEHSSDNTNKTENKDSETKEEKND